MKHFVPALIVFLLLVSSSAFAGREVGEGYAKPTFRELSQTIALDGGLDINDPKVADEYARLVYCNLYKENFKDDVVWNKLRGQIISRALEKKEYYRILYETNGVFKLDRYNFDGQYFPLTPDTVMTNVGSMVLFTADDFQPYCGLKQPVSVFPASINIQLNKPLTIDKFKIATDDVQKLLTRMDAQKNTDRRVYGRIRLRVTDVPGLVIFNGRVIRSELRGDVTGVDFFLDKDMTIPIGSSQWK